MATPTSNNFISTLITKILTLAHNVKVCFAYKFVELKVMAISPFERETKYKNIIIDKNGGCKFDSIKTCG